MKLRTLLALAVAGAFAVPLAAQASADGDRIILAQSGGPAGSSATGTGPTGGVPSPRTAGEPKAATGDRGAAAGATGTMSGSADFSALDRNGDGHISRAEWDAHYRAGTSSSGTGASGGATAGSTGSSSTGTTAGPGSASSRTGSGSDTATTPSTSGQGKAQ